MALQLVARSRSVLRNSLCFVLLNTSSHLSNTPTPSPRPVVYLSRSQSVKPPPPFLLFSNSNALLQRRHFTSSYGSSSLVIKQVCSFNLKTLSGSEYERALEKISWRFPLVDRVLGKGMRRTVRASEFHFSRSFLFAELGFDHVGYFSLLVSTETTRLVGIRRKGSLVLFDSELLSKKDDLCKVAEVEQVYFVEFKPKFRDDVPCIFPCEKNFIDAVKSLVVLLDTCESGTLDENKLGYYNKCLVFLYTFVVKGTVFSWTKSVVKNYLDEEGGLSFESLISYYEWERLSTAWHEGVKWWTCDNGLKCVIEDEVYIVKDKASPEEDIDTSKFNVRSIYEKEFEDRLRHFIPRKEEMFLPGWEFEGQFRNLLPDKKEIVLAAWNAAKNGFDETEYFHEAGFERFLADYKGDKFYGHKEETCEFLQSVADEARKAFKDATIVYFG